MNRLFAYCAIAAVLVVSGCGKKAAETQQEYQEKITNVAVYDASPTQFDEYITLPVVVTPDKEVNLGLTSGGKVTKIYVDKGDRVAKDKILLETDAVLLEAQLKNAESTLDYQKKEFDRSSKLFNDNSITEAAYDAAKFQYTQAQTGYDIAKKQLEDSVLKAPFGGIVTARNVEIGDILSPGTSAFRIIDMSKVKVQVGIPEKYIEDFKAGNAVSVKFDALPDEEFDGRIGFVSPEADPSVRTFLAEIIINNAKGLLKSGIMGDARILRKTFDDAIMIPLNAVIETQYGRIAFVAKPDNTAEQRTVETGGSDGTMVQVLAGIQSGDRVIVKGQHDLVNGEKINVTSGEAAQPAGGSGQ